MEALSRHNSSLIGLKITQPNSMILVSFSSAGDALFNDVKKNEFFARKVLKICRSAFFWDTRYIQSPCSLFSMVFGPL